MIKKIQNFIMNLFGLIIISTGIILLFSDVLITSFFIIFIGITLLPYTREFIYIKTSKRLDIKSQIFIYFISLILVVIIFSQENDAISNKQQVELAKKYKIEQEKRLEFIKENNNRKSLYFNDNKSSILADIKKSMDKKDFNSSLGMINNYAHTKDKDLLLLKKGLNIEKILVEISNTNISNLEKQLDLYKQLVKISDDNNHSKMLLYYENLIIESNIQKILVKISDTNISNLEKQLSLYQQLIKLRPDNTYTKQEFFYKNKIQEKKISTLLEKLKKVPASELKLNYDLYKELVKLDSDNKKYNKKVKYYKDKIEKLKIKKELEKAFYGKAPIPSAWDGSYSEVKYYLKSVMHDPSSLAIEQCSGVYKVDKGWAVLCSFRGKNSFGAMVLNRKWFIIRENRVVQVDTPDTYSIK